jgi:hypothetical protein
MSQNFNQWKQILCNKDALIEKLSGEISVCEWDLVSIIQQIIFLNYI